jgi:hypothetical protein
MMQVPASNVLMEIGEVFLEVGIIEMQLYPAIIWVKITELKTVDELICLGELVF